MDTGRNGDLRGRVNVRVSMIFSVLSSIKTNQSQLTEIFNTGFFFLFKIFKIFFGFL